MYHAIEDKMELILQSPLPSKRQAPSVVEDNENSNGKRQRRDFNPGTGGFKVGSGDANGRRIVRAMRPMHTS